MSETLFLKGLDVLSSLSSISPEERITMNKGLFAGGGAVAIIGAGYAGLIYYQGCFLIRRQPLRSINSPKRIPTCVLK